MFESKTRLDIVLIIFSYSGPSGILGSDESRIPLKPVLGDVIIVAISISSHYRLNKTDSAVF